MDKPGFIVPPPNVVPPRHDTETQTQRAPARSRELPVFLPASPGAPAAPPPSQTVVPPSATPTAPTAAPAGWRLVLPDGAEIAVAGALLLGRDPVRFDRWTTAVLIKLDDPQKSVSKTHAVLELVDGVLKVTDLHSTNGVFLTAPDGAETALEPGASASIVSGSSLDLGRYTILVDQN